MGIKLSAPNNIAGNYRKQKVLEIQRESYENTVSVGGFNTSLPRSVGPTGKNMYIEEFKHITHKFQQIKNSANPEYAFLYTHEHLPKFIFTCS